MKTKSVKKLLTVTLATAMILASTMTAFASSGASAGTTDSSSSQEVQEIKSFAEENRQSENATIKVGGTAVKTSIGGVYAAKKVNGCAFKTDIDSVVKALGLTKGQKPYAVIYDTDAKKSNKAMDSVNAAVEALSGKLIACLNVDLFAKQNGKVVTLSNGNVAMAVGLPKEADTTKTYCAVCVQPGGVTTVLEDQDSDPTTVTFAVQAGLGTYAIVSK